MATVAIIKPRVKRQPINADDDAAPRASLAISPSAVPIG